MKNLFNMDNPVFQTLSRIADLAVLSVICLLCCLPVVTIGPALVALNKTVYDLTIDRGGRKRARSRGRMCRKTMAMVLGRYRMDRISAFWKCWDSLFSYPKPEPQEEPADENEEEYED